jgi:Insertion element 4 transposase N-terminal
MARTVASLPPGSRITDYISLGVLTKTFPLDKVTAVVAAAGKMNQRQRDLPAHVVVYYVLALSLYMQVSYREVLRCLLEGIRWVLGP